MPNPATNATPVPIAANLRDIQALQDLRLGVELDQQNLVDGAEKLAALDHAIAALTNTPVLIAYAEGRIEHAGSGHCPDAVEGHDSRDSDCVVCQAMGGNVPPAAAADDKVESLAHELWSAAQLSPQEGILDGVDRITSLLRRYYPTDSAVS